MGYESALNPFLFAVVMDKLTVRSVCLQMTRSIVRVGSRWKRAWRGGEKVSTAKTAYMCVNERQTGVRVKVDDFKYLGSL